MSTYKRGSQETYAQINNLIEESYPDLHGPGVQFDIIMAFAPENESGEKTGPALKQHGHPCNYISSVVNLKNRIMGRMDGEILLDGDRFDDLTENQQTAILDSALHRFQVAKNVDGETIIDPHGRPKLKLRLHDRCFLWDDAIASRNGADSIEVQQATQLVKEAAQIYFQSTMALGDERRPKKKTLAEPAAEA